MPQSMAVFLLVKTAVAPHRCNHNHNPPHNVTKVTGKENYFKIYISFYISIPICGLFIYMWKHVISDFWCVINAVTVFAGVLRGIHCAYAPHFSCTARQFQKLQANKSSTVRLQPRHAMFLSANKRHWLWGNVYVGYLS